MYGTQPKSQFSKKAMYNYFERTPIKIDYATVPTADEWRATLRYRELVENASLAPPPPLPPPPSSSSSSIPPASSSEALNVGASTGPGAPPPPPPPLPASMFVVRFG